MHDDDPECLSAYDFRLPREQIAQAPLPSREASRLLLLDRDTGFIQHRAMTDFPEFVRPGDLLVLNETQVLPARLQGIRTATGGRWEGLFLGADGTHWRVIGQTRGRLQPGETIRLIPFSTPAASSASVIPRTSAEGPPPPIEGGKISLERVPSSVHALHLTLVHRGEEGEWRATVDSDAPYGELLEQFGTVPLPPYIRRKVPAHEDRERYQTTFARTPGSVAAPTAGLHFTRALLEQCRARGAAMAFVTLHVGLGTFRPVASEHLSGHRMHAEWCALPQSTVDAIRTTKESGGRVIAVGTTTVRTLETAAADGTLSVWSGETRLFIRPPFRFQVVDALLTNFHLPRSTLLVLVSAFAGRGRVLHAYHEAIERGYRFFSYGDAMFIAGG
jgi:S-adenosylmethionine:tRNA ribosyltransferase-isomerase